MGLNKHYFRIQPQEFINHFPVCCFLNDFQSIKIIINHSIILTASMLDLRTGHLLCRSLAVFVIQCDFKCLMRLNEEIKLLHVNEEKHEETGEEIRRR